MRCPVCKADNPAGPTCRRCKADMSLLWDVHARHSAILSSARRHMRNGNWRAAIAAAAAAQRLRSGTDSGQLAALARLCARDFPGAWRAYCSTKGALDHEEGQR
jgi:hypothetical protein